MDVTRLGHDGLINGAPEDDSGHSQALLLEMAAQVAGLGYFVVNLQTNVVEFCSERHAAIFGRTVDEYLNASSPLHENMSMLHPKDFSVVRRAYDRIKQGQKVELEYRFYRPDGARGYVREVVAPEVNDDGDPIRAIGSSIDVTQQREYYAKEDHARRLEALGTLTAGVAHDFNNTLSVIQGNADLLREDLDTSEFEQSVHDIGQAVAQGAGLIDKLLAFSRKAPLQLEVVDLRAIVDDVGGMLTRTLPTCIAVETHQDNEIWPVKADKLQVQNAIINMANNARDAIRNDGTLQIKLGNRLISSQEATECGFDLGAGSYVVLTLSDTGSGIAPEHIDRVFEPFYTTKPPGLGSGMGLAMVFGLMRQLGGATHVVSAVGAGTTFELYFPASEAESGAATVAQPSRQIDNPRVLLVEDEAQVRETLRKLLTKRGFVVSTASDGTQGLMAFAKDGPFDVVLTDLVMPGPLQGTHLAASIREIRPDMPLVFMSGYPLEAAIDEHDLHAEDVHLTKPVAIADLVAALESVL